jgi:DNA adenine methylase
MQDVSDTFQQAVMTPFLDPKVHAEPGRVVNVSTVPQRSPFRYPGGKTWLVPRVRLWLRSLPQRAVELIEPFAGGAIVSLTAVFENLVDRATLVELDDQVAAVWQTILSEDGVRLAEDVARFTLSAEAIRELLTRSHDSVYDLAFATLVKNRVQRGGILAPGASLMKAGENGRGLASRWYPQTLRKRILAIAGMRHRIRFLHTDGVAYLESQASRPDVVYFIDPPYTVAGKRLYTHFEIDHDRLFAIAATLAGDFLMTYDNTSEVRWLAEKHGFQTAEIAMMNTHNATKTELLIGKDLRWLVQSSS